MCFVRMQSARPSPASASSHSGAGRPRAPVARRFFTEAPPRCSAWQGGKLTTYRRIALAALGALRADLGLHRLDRAPSPLPGAADRDAVAAGLAQRWPQLEGRVSTHLAHLYGSLAAIVDSVLRANAGAPRSQTSHRY